MRLRVLVVEDNPINLELTAALLEQAGCDGYLTKPLDRQRLQEVLREFFAG